MYDNDKKKKKFSYSCVSFDYLDSESLLSHSSTDVTSIDTMAPNAPDSLGHSTPNFFSPQHPCRFVILSAQVFFYYLAYGYLQVSFNKIKN